MGQEIAATTLQSAMSYCSLANGGYLLKPSIIKSISRNSQNNKIRVEPQVIRSVMGEETSKAVLSMLCEVINKGTADKAQMHGFSLAGKTSTAQKFVDGSYSKIAFMSAFAGIYPSHQPRLVCLVVVDSPQYGKHWGNETAAPIVKKVIERIINLDSNKQDVKMIFAAAQSSNDNIKHFALQTSTVSTED
jgi:cell division protein FtsI (penicillin-binding protein 3)